MAQKMEAMRRVFKGMVNGEMTEVAISELPLGNERRIGSASKS